MGIIETLSAGFELVRRRPWLVLLPIVLDVGLWIAPKLSILSLMRGLLGEAAASVAAYPDMATRLPEMSQMLEKVAESANLGTLLSSGYLAVPSLPVAGTSFFGWTRQVVEVNSALGFVGLVAGLSLAGLMLGTLYLAPIADQVRDGCVDWPSLAGRLPRYWLRLLGAWFLIALALTFLGFPMVLMLGLFGLFSQGLASLMLGLASFAVLWVAFYLAFVPEAILYGEDGVLQAVGHSINVVRMHFWSTLGLLVLVNVIMAGLAFIWERLAKSAPGAVLAIAGNAYIGTGLTAAVFVFYRERLQTWQQAIEQLRSKLS